MEKHNPINEDQNRPVFGLSVREFCEITRQLISEELRKLAPQKSPAETDENDIIYIEELMSITGYKKMSIYSKVSRGELPTVSRNRPLTFSKRQILEWIKSGKPGVHDLKAQRYLFKKKIA